MVWLKAPLWGRGSLASAASSSVFTYIVVVARCNYSFLSSYLSEQDKQLKLHGRYQEDGVQENIDEDMSAAALSTRGMVGVSGVEPLSIWNWCHEYHEIESTRYYELG